MSSADYALQVAVQMEHLGRTFYESLAAGCGDAKISVVASKLAADELRHLQTFENMRNSLPADQRMPKLTEDQIIAIAGKFHKLILPYPDHVRQAALGGNINDVLQMAIKMEADLLIIRICSQSLAKISLF